MREVLFRGKRTDNGEWVEGFYVKFYSNGGSNPNYMIFTIDEQNRSSQPYAIDAETVCRYVGMHDGTKWEQLSKIEQDKFLSEWNLDKNRQNIKEDWCGRKVFEGDIVKYHFGEDVAPVKFGSYQSCFDSQRTEHCGFYVAWNGDRNLRKDLGYWIHMVDAKIIGNIFDNPELLEGGRS